MVHYKLHYFNWRGGVEGIRMMFHYKGVPFEDITYEHENFDSKRDAFPYKKLPVLEVDGKQLAQSHAILRYVSNELGLNGKDKFESAKFDELMELAHETQPAIHDYYGTVFGYGPGDREEYKKTKFLPALEEYTPLFLKALSSTGSGFYAKNGPCGVDFWLSQYFDFINHMNPGILDKKLLDHIDRVHALPELQDYLSKRPPQNP